MSISLDLPLSKLNGVGSKSAEGFAKQHIHTVSDILFNFPFRYEHLSTDISLQKAVLKGEFLSAKSSFTHKKKRIYQANFVNSQGYFSAIWLNIKNESYLRSLFEEKKTYYLYGTITMNEGRRAIFHPELIDANDLGTVRPIYSIPQTITLAKYKKLISYALEAIEQVEEDLPKKIIEKYSFPAIKDSILTLHMPESYANAEKIINRSHPAFKRFIYSEIFYLQCIVQLKNRIYKSTSSGIAFNIDKSFFNIIKNNAMPFNLTQSQRDVLLDIINDLSSHKQMNRLVQGDVGSGKTILAFISAALVIHAGYQAVLIAPTEVLAEQHYSKAKDFFEKLEMEVALISGSTPNKEKLLLKGLLEQGRIDFIVGTHALLEDDVNFKKLGLVISDEQHRFGVKQRKALIDKGYTPDVLLMTATPIPRTLAMTMYADLNCSVIGELPPGRIPSKTLAFPDSRLEDAYKFVAERLAEGKRAYFVYPLVSESDKLELKAATESYEHIKEFFSDKSIGLLHGKMKPTEKRELLENFRKGELDILVSTTVIEVGVDVPEATIMVIENAERFGLSQLHQLRGRVGRNSEQSYCLLIYSKKITEVGYKRIQAMVQYHDGFKLSEIDLELRGQGDFFGTKQSGLPSFRYADILKDIAIISAAQHDVAEILDEDPKLTSDDYLIINKILKKRFENEVESFFNIA